MKNINLLGLVLASTLLTPWTAHATTTHNVYFIDTTSAKQTKTAIEACRNELDKPEFLDAIKSGLSSDKVNCIGKRYVYDLKKANGLTITAVAKHMDSNNVELKISEEKRKSRLTSDLDIVLSFFKKSNKTGLRSNIKYTKATKALTHERATITVKTSIDVNGKTSANESNIIGGKTEHWYMSVDYPLTSISELKYDPKSNALELKDKPSDFYLSFNYAFGDLFKTTGWSNVHGKLMFNVKEPSNYWGVGLGYRFPSLFDNGEVSVFGANIYSRDDSADGATVKENLGASRNSVIYGISYSVSTL